MGICHLTSDLAAVQMQRERWEHSPRMGAISAEMEGVGGEAPSLEVRAEGLEPLGLCGEGAGHEQTWW